MKTPFRETRFFQRENLSVAPDLGYTFFPIMHKNPRLAAPKEVVAGCACGIYTMPDHSGYDQWLLALKARLRLDMGLGIEYVSGLEAGVDRERLLAAVSAGSPVAGRAASAGTDRRAYPEPRPRPEIRAAESPVPEGHVAVGAAKAETFTRVPLHEAKSCPEREAALAPWREKAMACSACGLCGKRATVVWGEGALDASVMFIGEGPGKEEDEQGRPFVGRSGRLLTDIIEKGMKVARREVYITNVVKCRPPGNRDPKSGEVAACGEFLNRQIDAISPRIIVAVGGVAGCALLGLPPKSGGLRGRWHEYRGIPLRVIYHPSYLLRQRGARDERTKADRDTWEDIQQVMARL